MPIFLIQEEYKENVVGVRVVSVIADSKQDVLDGDYEMNDIVEELSASADCYETSMVDDDKYLLADWKEIVKEEE